MLKKISAVVLGGVGLALAYGTSAYTVEGVQRVFSATTPTTEGADAFFFNLFKLNGAAQTFVDVDSTADNTLARFDDFRGIATAYFGAGYAAPLVEGLGLELAVTGSYCFDYWDREDGKDTYMRKYPRNRSSYDVGDMYAVMKLGYLFPNKLTAIGGAVEATFATGKPWSPETLTVSENIGIRNPGGIWRKFTQDEFGLGGRFLLSFFPANGNINLHFNVGYHKRNLKEDADDAITGGFVFMPVIGLLRPFAEVYFEQWINDTTSDGPAWLTLGFRIDFGGVGLVMDMAWERMFRYGSTGEDTVMALFEPTRTIPDWRLDNGGWIGLNYTYQGLFIKPEKKPAGGTIVVTVLDQETKQPVPEATVGIPEAQITPKAVDPATGFVRLDSVPEGQYTIQVAAPGYQGYTEVVLVQEGQITQRTVFLSKIKPQVTEGTVVGRVIDAETHQPIENATVSIPGANVQAVNVKPGTGEFKFEKVKGGTYTVQATAPGYQPASKMITVQPGQVVTVELTLVKETPNVAVVTGRVYNAKDNTNIAGAYLTLTGGSSSIPPVQSDQSGIYRFDNVPPGTYTIKCTAPGYKEVAEVITLQKGQVLVKDFPLQPSVVKSVLVIHVVDRGTGNPLPAELKFIGSNLPPAQTDPSTGVWQGEVPVGTYTVSATVIGLKGYVPQVKTVVVKEGQPAELRFEMVKKGFKITFRNIYFKKASAELLPSAMPALQEILKFLQENPTAKIEIQGHTSTEGSTAYNQRLSEQRANAVRTWLIQHGISPDRLIAVGYGESQPEIYPERSEADRMMNRRVVIKVIGEVQQ